MRLIDADTLENELREVISKRHSKRTILALYMMLDIIRDRDTIKAVPVKYSKWIRKYPIYICSECTCYSGKPTIYCPDCGAKMDPEAIPRR